MSRNGSGVYSVVNTFVPGASITAAGHNQNWSDLASEMTNSVAADGQTTMTGPLKASSGTVAAPSITFGADTDSGLYRIGANNVGVAVNGTKIIDVATTGATVTGNVSATGDVSATGTVKQAGFALIPVGVIWPYGGAAAPPGYLLCDGSAVSRTTYAALFTVIGTSYGAGDGSTTFNVPNMKGRVPAGLDDTGTILTSATMTPDGNTRGATGGAQVSTLSTANLPAYTPVGTNTGGAATFSFTVGGNFATTGASNAVTNITPSGGGSGLTTVFTQPTFTGTAQGGTSTAFTNVQPTIVTNYIIFAGV